MPLKSIRAKKERLKHRKEEWDASHWLWAKCRSWEYRLGVPCVGANTCCLPESTLLVRCWNNETKSKLELRQCRVKHQHPNRHCCCKTKYPPFHVLLKFSAESVLISGSQLPHRLCPAGPFVSRMVYPSHVYPAPGDSRRLLQMELCCLWPLGSLMLRLWNAPVHGCRTEGAYWYLWLISIIYASCDINKIKGMPVRIF